MLDISIRPQAGLYTDDEILRGWASPRVSLDRTILPPQMSTTPVTNPDLIGAEECFYFSPWYRAIYLVTMLMMKTQFVIKKCTKTEGGITKTEDIDHPAAYALKCQANPNHTAGEFRHRLTQLMMIYGTGRAVIEPPDTMRGTPLRLWPMLNGELEMLYANGIRYYARVANSAEQDPQSRYFWIFDSSEVIDLTPLRATNNVTPIKPWYNARYAVTEGIGGNVARSVQARNGGRPQIALSTEKPINKDQIDQLRNDFRQQNLSYENTGIPLVLGSGLQPHTLDYNHDLEAAAAMAKIPAVDVSNFTHVPLALLGYESSGASIEEQIRNFHQFGMGLYFSIWVDQLVSKLLTPRDRLEGNYTIEADVKPFDWATLKDAADAVRAFGAGTPIMTANNLRTALGQPPLQEPEANKLQFPKNIGNTGSNSIPTPGDKPPAGRPKGDITSVLDRVLKTAERKSSNEKAYMDFCSSLQADPTLKQILTDKLGPECGERCINTLHSALLQIAECPKGKLHDAFHERAPMIYITLPEML